jgi:hypothetical protein
MPRAVAEQVLEALVMTQREAQIGEADYAIAALRATLAQQAEPAADAETYLRDRYGAARGHHAWRELTEAFNAGCASAQQAEVDQDELHAEAILQALIAEWEAKAATWLQSPEAAQRLHGYRDLAKRLATTELKAEQMRALIADDSHAASFQSLGQYRSALLRAIKEGQR